MIIINGAFYQDSEQDHPIVTEPLFVTSAGHHTLIKQKSFKTIRPNGRRDYQILYVQKGKLYYYIKDKKYLCPEGSILLYKPNEPQIYVYYCEDNSDIFWIHFTGNDVESWLAHNGISNKTHMQLHPSENYSRIFNLIIGEFQHKLFNYSQIINTQFKELLYHFSRGLRQNDNQQNKLSREVEAALEYFNNHYKEPFNIGEFAASLNISVSWFTRIFKKQIGSTPHKYLTELRISKSKSLLQSNMSIGEIAENVGFSDQLYFSRVFSQVTGVSPSKYKKQTALKNLPSEKIPWHSETRQLPNEP